MSHPKQPPTDISSTENRQNGNREKEKRKRNNEAIYASHDHPTPV